MGGSKRDKKDKGTGLLQQQKCHFSVDALPNEVF